MPNVEVHGQVISFPDDMPPDQLKMAVSKAASKLSGGSKSNADILLQAGAKADPSKLIRRAAPSNLGRLAGVGVANAPDAASLLMNSIPGVGNPAEIVPNVQGIQKNPNQLLEAAKRMSAVQNKSPLTPREKVPATVGQVGGTAFEIAAQPFSPKPNIKATGPFTAGLQEPSTALPGAFQRTGEALGDVKRTARVGDDALEASKLRILLSKPGGPVKLAEEAKAVMEGNAANKWRMSITRLLAYRQALGEAQAKGGSLVDDYAQAVKETTAQLKIQAPALMEKMEEMHLNFLARGGKPKSFPWLYAAINPKVGLLKALGLPPVRNLAGAVANRASLIAPKAASGLNSLSEAYGKEDQ